MRGMLLKILLDKKELTMKQIAQEIDADTDHVFSVLDDLVREGFVKKAGRLYVV